MDKLSALKLMRKRRQKQGVTPATIVTDKLGSYSAEPCACFRDQAMLTPHEH